MLKIDLHIHTVASRHAHNTILEYINQAKKLKMKVIGISDHGPDCSTTLTDQIYFRELKRMPDMINGIRVLMGTEANIIGQDGALDIIDKTIDRLDYVMAGLHYASAYQDGGRETNTRSMINAISSGKFDIITHPFDNKKLDFDIVRVCQTACDCKVLPEVNLSYFNEEDMTTALLENLKTMINVVKKHKWKVIVNSDSHNIWELADDRPLKSYKKQIGLTDDLVINNYPKELLKILNLKK